MIEVGKHCAHPDCHQLDFLPFTCDFCHKVFCAEHRLREEHTCVSTTSLPANVAVNCPICNAIVYVHNEPIDDAISRHIDAGCAPSKDASGSASSTKTLFRCHFAKCIERELTRITCNECGLQTCLRHRAPTAHQCVARAERAHDASVRAAAAASRDTRHESVLERIRSLVAGGAAANSPAAVSVRRIQHRQRATGDKRVPADERAYFEVLFPFDSGVEPRPMFFQQQGVGRTRARRCRHCRRHFKQQQQA
jgi:predicted nucleic acid binding AN1-type Zn finger protein